jgi:hypothetical protein
MSALLSRVVAARLCTGGCFNGRFDMRDLWPHVDFLDGDARRHGRALRRHPRSGASTKYRAVSEQTVVGAASRMLGRSRQLEAPGGAASVADVGQSGVPLAEANRPRRRTAGSFCEGRGPASAPHGDPHAGVRLCRGDDRRASRVGVLRHGPAARGPRRKRCDHGDDRLDNRSGPRPRLNVGASHRDRTRAGAQHRCRAVVER